MKKFAIAAVAAAMLATSGFYYVSAQEGPKAEKAVIVGVAVAIPQMVMSGRSDESEAEAFKYQAEQGFPVGILEDETGDLYICVFRDNAPASHLETANATLAPYMGKKVVATGLAYKGHGVNVLRIGVMSEY